MSIKGRKVYVAPSGGYALYRVWINFATCFDSLSEDIYKTEKKFGNGRTALVLFLPKATDEQLAIASIKLYVARTYTR